MLTRLLTVLFALALSAACSGQGGGGQATPSGPELMTKTAEAMKTVKTARFAISTEGTPQVPVRKGDGRILATGDADGTLTVDLFGQLTEISFVLVGDTVHFKGPTGSFQTMSRASLLQALNGYDPSLLLDPAKGVPLLLAGAGDPKVEGEEGGAYKVTAKLPQQQLKTLVPGVSQDVTAQMLVDKASSRLTKVTLPLQGGSVTVTLSDYDAPVTITPPAG
ncbi:LppX_LprAFG lipoprotein [Thermoactinospora rubra]|uniref:LppX_LprAFG lipoprotein n=1 Tax=Thermoactinospora rubra TaxID=1088767 RepID=UPI000A112465|nr:LppX_LprAFG lipoprotein [Thermoactinospora rubra]